MRSAPTPPPPLALTLALLTLSCSAPAPGEDVSTTSAPLTVCPAGSTVKGIDVSVYQGDVDWPTAKATGLKFAIARISDGTSLDTKFAANWSAMKSVGLVRGAYQFFEPGDDPTAQAQIVVDAVGRLGDGDLPVTADMEVTGSEPAATIVAHLQTWMAAVEAGTGKAPMIYTALGYWNESVDSTAFATSPLWVANWGATCPDLPTAWSEWKFWQYADDGSVAGVTGNVDEDEFNGSLADLEAFASPPVDAGTDAAAASDANDGEDVARGDASTGFMTESAVTGSSGGCEVGARRGGEGARGGLAALALAVALCLGRRRSHTS